MLSPALTVPVLCTWPAATPPLQHPLPSDPGLQVTSPSSGCSSSSAPPGPCRFQRGVWLSWLFPSLLTLRTSVSHDTAVCTLTHLPHTPAHTRHPHQSHTHPSTRTGTPHCTPTCAHDPGSPRPLLNACAGGTIAS